MGFPRKHAALIHAWADGAEIELRESPDAEWRPAPHPNWYAELEYRVRPSTIIINGHEVPEPVREPLEQGWQYWIPQPIGFDLALHQRWLGRSEDLKALSRGLIHLTREDAEVHACALISFTRAK